MLSELSKFPLWQGELFVLQIFFGHGIPNHPSSRLYYLDFQASDTGNS